MPRKPAQPTAARGSDVHPVAALFPMLDAEDLKALAQDIAERGQLHPIVLDADGRVLDGRNRMAACDIAGVEPVFETYDGDDPDGYALAVNIARRNLTKGQTAMIAARAILLCNTEQAEAAKSTGTSQTRVSQANVVIDFAPDLVDGVIAGATPLNDAYLTARDRKKAATKTDDAMTELRTNHPELADLVTAGDLTLAEALKTGRERVRSQNQHEIDQASRLARNVVSGLELVNPQTRENYRDYWLKHADDVAGATEFVTPENLRSMGEAYVALAELFEGVSS